MPEQHHDMSTCSKNSKNFFPRALDQEFGIFAVKGGVGRNQEFCIFAVKFGVQRAQEVLCAPAEPLQRFASLRGDSVRYAGAKVSLAPVAALGFLMTASEVLDFGLKSAKVSQRCICRRAPS